MVSEKKVGEDEDDPRKIRMRLQEGRTMSKEATDHVLEMLARKR